MADTTSVDGFFPAGYLDAPKPSDDGDVVDAEFEVVDDDVDSK